MRIERKTILQTILFAIIGIGLVVWRYQTLSDADKAAMYSAFNTFQWIWALPIFLVGLFSHIVRGLRWDLQFKALSIPYKRFNTFGAVMLGYMTNILVPRLGEVSRCTVVAKYSGAPVDKIIGTVIAERLWDMICFCMLALITLLIEFDILMPYATTIFENLVATLKQPNGAWNFTKISLLAIGWVIGLVALIFIYNKVKHTKIASFIKGVKNGLQSIWLVQNKGLFLVYTFLLWGAYTLVAVFVYKAIPDLAHLPWGAGLSIITFGTFAMVVPAPGSIAYPIIVAPILTLYGVSIGMGQGFGWINWANQNLTVIILGLLVMMLLPILNSNKKNDKIRNHSA